MVNAKLWTLDGQRLDFPIKIAGEHTLISWYQIYGVHFMAHLDYADISLRVGDHRNLRVVMFKPPRGPSVAVA